MVIAGALLGSAFSHRLFGADDHGSARTLAYAGAAGALTTFIGMPVCACCACACGMWHEHVRVSVHVHVHVHGALTTFTGDGAQQLTPVPTPAPHRSPVRSSYP